MVHKTSNSVIKTELNSNTKSGFGIHKYNSISSYLDEYDREVDRMHQLIDKEYEESERRQEEAEARIKQLQNEEELERQMEEERAFQEELRQLELEKAKAEVEVIKERLKELRREQVSPKPIILQEPLQEKEPLKSKVMNIGKKITEVAGKISGKPSIKRVAKIIPSETKKEPKYEDDYLVYGSWEGE